jgi:hypothetical protein
MSEAMARRRAYRGGCGGGSGMDTTITSTRQGRGDDGTKSAMDRQGRCNDGVTTEETDERGNG